MYSSQWNEWYFSTKSLQIIFLVYFSTELVYYMMKHCSFLQARAVSFVLEVYVLYLTIFREKHWSFYACFAHSRLFFFPGVLMQLHLLLSVIICTVFFSSHCVYPFMLPQPEIAQCQHKQRHKIGKCSFFWMLKVVGGKKFDSNFVPSWVTL